MLHVHSAAFKCCPKFSGLHDIRAGRIEIDVYAMSHVLKDVQNGAIALAYMVYTPYHHAVDTGKRDLLSAIAVAKSPILRIKSHMLGRKQGQLRWQRIVP